MTARKGFTLIELLVVISIIAVLSAIAIVAFGTVSKNGRDAKRVTDLRTTQGVLEQYYADQGYYPTTVSFGSALTSPDGTKTYYYKLPKDPNVGSSYIYSPSASKSSDTSCDNSTESKCITYCLYANMENDSSLVSDSNRFSSGICTSANGANATDYALSPL